MSATGGDLFTDPSDEAMAIFLGVPIAMVQRFNPQFRAKQIRMFEICAKIKAWEAGKGPKPEGVLLDMPRTRLPDMRKTPAKPGKNQRGHPRER